MSMHDDSFWNASVEEICRGHVYDTDQDAYICLVCGLGFIPGNIYSLEGSLYEAGKAASLHVEKEHGGMVSVLLQMDKKATGLTDNQKEIISYFSRGVPDGEIAGKLGVSNSTIRNYRFGFRERARSARIFLALWRMIENRVPAPEKFINFPRTAVERDERTAITEKENRKILDQYFTGNPETGSLTMFPRKEKKKLAILRNIMKRFEPRRKYTEKEVNQVLEPIFHDYVTLRRYLVDYGFLDRQKDCTAYWVKE